MNKKSECEIGDLVHIPQAVQLVDMTDCGKDPQLSIPLRFDVTESPKIGVVTHTTTPMGYLRVLCEGDIWSVQAASVYTLKGKD